ncbi:MAG: YraN family protein [Chitinophagales bacterium]
MKKHSSQRNGLLGEQAACNFLKEQGYTIIYRNWRTGRLEVDIICFDPMKTLVFVEVKARSSKHFGAPGNFVDAKKRQHLMAAAEAYCQKFEHYDEIRFDIISIILANETIQEIKHYCDAFYEIG